MNIFKQFFKELPDIANTYYRNIWTILGMVLFALVVVFALLLANVKGCEGAEVVVETIALESSSEPFEAQIMVAQVILTRSKERGLTLEEVVLQPYQFSCHNKGIRKTMKKRSRSELSNARKALLQAQHSTNLPKVNLYHDTSIRVPYWAKSARFVCQIGKLRFYYE